MLIILSHLHKITDATWSVGLFSMGSYEESDQRMLVFATDEAARPRYPK